MSKEMVLVEKERYDELIKNTIEAPEEAKVETPRGVQKKTARGSKHLEVLQYMISKNLLKKLNAFIEYLLRGDISWNEQGEVSLDGRQIRDSHVTDLIKHAVYPCGNRPPYGYDSFSNYLQDIKMPQSLWHSNGQSGTGLVRGPTKGPPPNWKKVKPKMKNWITF